MSKQYTMRDWQRVICDMVMDHETLVSGEEYQSLSDYDISRLTRIRLSLPKGSGHTTFTALLAASANKPAIIVYHDIAHWNEIRNVWDGVAVNVDAISASELTCIVLRATQDPELDTQKMKTRFEAAGLVIVDMASKLMPGVEDFIYGAAAGNKVVLLD